MMLKCILLSISGFFFMGNKLIKIGNDVSCPKFGEKINYCPWFSDQTSRVIFFLVQMEKITPPRCSDRSSFMQFGIVHLTDFITFFCRSSFTTRKRKN